MVDVNDKELKIGDIIDLHQTVNGQNLFVIASLSPLDVRYHYDMTRRYQYDQEALLAPCRYSGEVEYEIVGHVDSIPLVNIPETMVDKIMATVAVGKPILEKFNKLRDKEIKLVLKKIFGFRIPELLYTDTAEVHRLIRSEELWEISIHYYDSLTIDAMGISITPEHGTKRWLAPFSETYNVNLINLIMLEEMKL